VIPFGTNLKLPDRNCANEIVQIERWQARPLRAAYEHRLRAIKGAPLWVTELILSASEQVDEDRVAVSDN